MEGPNIQMPPAQSEFFDFEYDRDGNIASVRMKPAWASFMQSLNYVAYDSTRSGNTSSRPTSTMVRWVGMPYFDTDLGFPIFLRYSTSNVWVDAAGNVV